MVGHFQCLADNGEFLMISLRVQLKTQLLLLFSSIIPFKILFLFKGDHVRFIEHKELFQNLIDRNPRFVDLLPLILYEVSAFSFSI